MTGQSAPSKVDRRPLLWGGATVVLLGLVLLVWKGPNTIRQWQHQRFLAQGKELLAAGNYQEAGFAIRKAILKAPGDPESYRLMADLIDRVGSPQAAQWRAKAVEAGATNAADYMHWAEASLRAGDVASATKALATLDASATNSAIYHKLSGVLATALHKPVEAEAHFLEAIRLEPTNSAPQLNLAAIRLASTNATQVEAGRTAMLQLASRPDVRREALRHLAGDALRHRKSEQAVNYGRQLLAGTNVPFTDRILFLDTLKAAASPELSDAIVLARQAAGTNGVQVFAVAHWMYADGRAREVLSWIKTQPAEVQRAHALRLLTVECLAAVKDTEGMATFLDEEPWGEHDYYRLCLQARLHRAQGQAAAAEAVWRRALRMASTQPERLLQVLRLTKEWQWLSEYQETLASLLERSPREVWAVQELATLYHAEGKTRQLHGLLSRTLDLAPTNAMIKNNFAMTSLLLNPRDERGIRLAREAYEQQGTNAQFAATYAFSLLNQKQPAEALAVFSKLEVAALEQPSVAAYYGLALASAGKKADAAKYLGLSEKAQLLPEETHLVAQARAGL